MVLSRFPLRSGLVGVAAALVLLPAEMLVSSPARAEFEDNPKTVVDEAWQIVNADYVDADFNRIDWQATRQELLSDTYTSPEAAYAALRSALRQLNDPYTRFLSPQEYASLTDQTAGEVSGVGLRLRKDRRTGLAIITEVAPDSPAEQAGLQVDDEILLVNGQGTDRLTVEGVFRQLRGEEGSQVTLTVASEGGTRRTVVLLRSRLDLPTVDYAVKTAGSRPIGYIRLSEFNANATAEMADAITSLVGEGVEGFVLDLRGNPGGLLLASIDISRMWLQHGPIVRTLDRSGESEAISANRTALTELPLTVLVDGRSASSSEILTGALQDNRRATVVGAPTFGKALVQSLHGLSDGSGLTVTVAHYYTPNGTDISSKGITPDIEVTLSRRQRQDLFDNPTLLGTEADAQFVRATAVLAQALDTDATPQLGRTSEDPSAAPQ